MKLANIGLTFSLFFSPIASLMAAKPSRETAPVSSLSVSLCFLRNKGIWVRKAGATEDDLWYSDGTILGTAISPQGDSIAIAGRFQVNGEKYLQRRIAIVDRKGASPRLLNSIPMGSCSDPIWSPDGKSILFSLYNSVIVDSRVEAKTKPAIVSRDGSGFRFLSKEQLVPLCWSKEGNSIYMADWQKIWRVSLDTNELVSFDLRHEGFKYLAADSGFLSPDGEKMLLHGEVSLQQGELPSEADMALFLFDLRTQRLERLSLRGSDMDNACWLPDGRGFVFHEHSAKEGHRIILMDLKTRRKTVVVEGGLCPSLSK
jgi:hypothetical protein